jgi:predicted enzyme related to lactoylglutathione lyase
MIFTHAISWFEIPTQDIGRAQRFYETIFDMQMIPLHLPQLQMRLFPIKDPMNVGGALSFHQEFYRPSVTDGVLLYLNANPDLQLVLDRIELAGGKIIIPKTQITPEYGFMAVFIDTEGNRLALHSNPQ